jgi:hypothetical protein
MGEAALKEQTKKEEFEKNPDDFVNVHDCMLIVQRHEKEGKKFFSVMNNCQSIEDVFVTEGFANEAMQNRRDQIRVIQSSKNRGGIQVASSMPVPPSKLLIK